MSLRGLEGFKYEAMQVEVKRRGHLGRLRVGSLLARRMMMLPKDRLTDSANPTGGERERETERARHAKTASRHQSQAKLES